jgi:hypothetical protein
MVSAQNSLLVAIDSWCIIYYMKNIFRGYEQAPGYEPGHTSVLVRESVLEHEHWGGTPDVDYDNLTRLLKDDLGLPAEKWTIKAHVGSAMGHINPPLDKLRESFHVPFTRTLHVGTYSGNLFMEKVIQGLIPIADHNGDRSYYTKFGLATIPIVGSVAIAQAVEASPYASEGLALLSAVAALAVYNSHSKVREQKEHGLLKDHAADILFPYDKGRLGLFV